MGEGMTLYDLLLADADTLSGYSFFQAMVARSDFVSHLSGAPNVFSVVFSVA